MLSNLEPGSKRQRFLNLFKSDKEIEEEQKLKQQDQDKQEGENEQQKKSSGSSENAQQKQATLQLDENDFVFSLKGGSVHTELLQVECEQKQKDGEGDGMPVPVECKWFLINQDEGSLSPMDTITGQFYQPCIDDVNFKICVQATPILDNEEYIGMPLRKEIGPLIIDPEVQQEGQQKLEAGSYETDIFIIETHEKDQEVKIEQTPVEVIIKISLEKIIIEQDNNILYETLVTEQFPQASFSRITSQMFDVFLLQLNEDLSLKIRAKSNKKRDILAVALRSFCGKKMMEKIDQDLEEEGEGQENSVEQLENPENPENNDNEVQQQQQLQQQGSKNSSEIKSNSEEKNQQQQSEQNNNSEQQQQDQINEQQEQQEENSQQKNLSSNNTSALKDQDMEGVDLQRGFQKHHSVLVTPSQQQQQQQSQKPGYEIYMKLNQMSQNVKKLQKENQELKKKLEESQENCEQKQSKIDTLEEQMKNLTQNYFNLNKEQEKTKKENNELVKENNFLQQDLNYQIVFVEDMKVHSEETQQKYEELVKQVELEASKKPERIITLEEYEQQQNKIREMELKLFQSEEEKKQLEKQNQEKKSKIKKIKQENENFFDEVKYMKQKYRSLQKEKHMKFQIMNYDYDLSKSDSFPDENTDAQSVTQSQVFGGFGSQKIQFLPGMRKGSIHLGESVQFPYSAHNLDHFDDDTLSTREYNHEYSTLKAQVNILEATLESMKKAYDRDVNKKKKKKKDDKNEKAEHQLQQVANRLAEVITDKELALDHQKRVNKELVRKIKQFQQYLSQNDISMTQLDYISPITKLKKAQSTQQISNFVSENKSLDKFDQEIQEKQQQQSLTHSDSKQESESSIKPEEDQQQQKVEQE